jgi:ferritin-like protein
MIKFDENHNVVSLPTENSNFPPEKLPFLIFLDRIWNDKRFNFHGDVNFNQILISYVNMYGSDSGIISEEFTNILRKELENRLPSIGKRNIDYCVDRILKLFLFTPIIFSSPSLIEDEDEGDVYTKPIVHTHDTAPKVIQNPDDDDDNDNIENDGEDDLESIYDEDLYTKIEIYPKDEINIFKIQYFDRDGLVTIPFIINLDSFEFKKSSNVVDSRNGNWDWLTHTVPDKMFYTKDPEKYLSLNTMDLEDTHNLRFAILSNIIKDNEETCIVGVYTFSGVYIIDKNGDEEVDNGVDLLEQVNYLVQSEIANSSSSYWLYSITNEKSLILNEEEVVKYLDQLENFDLIDNEITDPVIYDEAINENDNIVQEVSKPTVIPDIKDDAIEIIKALVDAENTEEQVISVENTISISDDEEITEVVPDEFVGDEELNYMLQAQNADNNVVVEEIYQQENPDSDSFSEDEGDFMFKPIYKKKQLRFIDGEDPYN